ncbi:MAG: diacylglycerol kinase family lipid kinase [Chloroflexia bacterium]|nr:diacylglycerol kinase family lipid kinase [Chloroflexia bacterium]
MNVFVVLNPVAGQSDPRSVRQALERHLEGAGWPYEIYRTTGEERLDRIVRDALERGFDLFVAAGGDGTVSGVAGGLVHMGVPLAILPTGTGNALARDLQTPLDLERALELLTGAHATRCIDAMQVGKRHFFLNVGVGASARMMRDTERNSKRHFGRLAYFWAGLLKLLGLRRYRFQVNVDGEEHRFKAAEVMVLNSGALGAPYLRLGRRIELDDGLLEMYVIRARSLTKALRLLGHALLGQEESNSDLQRLSARQHVRIDCRRPLPVQADGDVIGRTPIEIELRPRAVQVVVPEGV